MRYSLLISSLQTLASLINLEEGGCAVTGSASLQLQGIDCDASDIDILAQHWFAEKASIALADFNESPLAYSQSDRIKSYFARYRINNVSIEIMSDVKNLNYSDIWIPHEEWKNNIKLYSIKNFNIPVLTLEYELKIARMLNQKTRVELLSEKLKEI